MYVLYMHLNAGPIGSLCCPYIKVLMPSSLEVEAIVTIVKIGKFGKKVKVLL